MPHHLFNISKDVFWSLGIHEIESNIKNNSSWETYDENCKRCSIKFPEKMIDHIYKLSNLTFPIKIEDTISHYVSYNINNQYIISRHNDGCRITIIIYIDKNPNISETLFIEDNLIKKNLWSEDTSTLGCLAMWSDDYDMGPDHYVNIQGSGKRDVLCLFLG